MKITDNKPTRFPVSVFIMLFVSMFGVSPVFAQGLISFSNIPPPANAPIFHTDCRTPLEGNAFVAGLYAGVPGAIESELVMIGRPVGFIEGEGAGYFADGSRRLPFIEPGHEATVQVRVWEAQAGSFEAARAGVGLYGMSQILPVQTGTLGEPGGVGTLTGLESFCLIPEPSTQWLFGAGGAFLLGWCLRKNRKRNLSESRA